MSRLYFIPVRYHCPANCPFCITKKQFDRPSENSKEFIDYDNFLKTSTLKELSKFDTVEITGGGEPLLHEKILSMIRIFNKRSIYVKLYTNGFISKILFNDINTSTKDNRKKIYVDELTLSKMSLNDIDNDKLQKRKLKNSFPSNLLPELNFFNIFCKKIRIRMYISEEQIINFNNCPTDEKKEKYLLSINGLFHLFSPSINRQINTIIFCNDINKTYKIPNDFKKIAKSLFSKIPEIEFKIDNNEKYCPEFPILFTDGNFYPNWGSIMKKGTFKNEKFGYHINSIKKGTLGDSSKILEEVNELIDSEKQNNKIMSLVELSDIYGALESYLLKNFKDLKMEDLKIMSDTTKRVFQNGFRK